MKISRISRALGSISDEFSREAIEEIEKSSNQNDSAVPEEKPRVVSEERQRKAPIVIALAGLCAAAAIALPLVLKNVGNNSLVASDNSSGVAASAPKVEKLGYDLDGSEDYGEYKFEFTMPEYEGVVFECTGGEIRANGETIAVGMPMTQNYLADLNGDGLREIVSCTSFGSGIIDERIYAYDYSGKQFYVLENRMISNFTLFMNNGELWVRETEYRGENVLSEKKLELSDMEKIDGLTQEPVRAAFDGAEIPCVDDYESIQEQALDSLVFETHVFGDYTVNLVGKQVFKFDKNVTDYVYAKELCIEVEKDGKPLDSFTPNLGYFNLGGITDRPKYTVFADKVGSYLDLYELEQPVIAMRYYFGEESELSVKKAVQFAVIKDGVVYGGFLPTAEAGTGVTPFQDYYAANVEDDCICVASVFEADKFTIIDGKTLIDDAAKVKFIFSFEDMLKEGKLYKTEKLYDDEPIGDGTDIGAASDLQGTKPDFYGDVISASYEQAVKYAKELGCRLGNYGDNPDFVRYNIGLAYPDTEKERVMYIEYQFRDFTISVEKYNEDNSLVPDINSESLVYSGLNFYYDNSYGNYRLAYIDERQKLYYFCSLYKPDDSNVVKDMMIDAAK